MKLALRLVVWLLLPMTIVVIVNVSLLVRREHRLFEEEAIKTQRALGRALAAGIADGWIASPDHAAHVLRDAAADGAEMRLQWIPLHASELAGRWTALEAAELAGRHEVVRRPAAGPTTLYPVFIDDELVGVVSIEGSTNAELRYLRGSVVRSAAQTLLLIVLCMAAAILAGLRLVGRPIAALTAHARAVAAGQFHSRVDQRFDNELDDLATELNAMAAQLAASREQLEAETKQKEAALAQVHHADRLITIGKLSAGIAHELGTPLNVVLGRAQEIADGDVAGEDAKSNARTIAAQVERMSVIVRGLLDFARPRRSSKRDDDAATLFSRVAGMLAPLARKRNVELEVATHEQVALRADPQQLEQVIVNLVMNAVQAMPDGGRVRMSADVVRRAAPGSNEERAWSRLRISDGGRGIPDEIRDSVFDPFFTTKEPGEGTGLGLAVVWGLVAQHGGFVTFESVEGRGTTFDVWLPREET